jgi:serine/threonine protein kinase
LPAFEPAKPLLHFRLVEKIGEGGMGVVWKALDTTLDREVAIKVLPEALSGDPERLARFEREARILASLSHPNIAAVYGLHESDGTRFLSMELVSGEDLAERLARGPLEPETAIDVARQVSAALEAAHETGVIHRDLKPANIRITNDGRVKVLDFGLAKALDPAGSGVADAGLSKSPTITTGGTIAGAVLGTAAYMAPEQAKGNPVDRRADVWAFGCVLYEMLAGRRVFQAETISETIAQVLMGEPDLDALPGSTPAHVRRLIGRALRRDARVRLQWIGEARVELEEGPSTERGRAEPAGAEPRKSIPLSLASVIALCGVVLGALLVLALSGDRRASEEPGGSRERVVSSILPPAGHSFDTNDGPPALTRDGRRLAFLAAAPGESTQLFVREMQSGEIRRIEGTSGAMMPFWSPDGRQLAFFADGLLKKTDTRGGPIESLAGAPEPLGGSWSDEDVIIFVAHYHSPPRIVDASGGEVRELPAPYDGLLSPWYTWPRLMPGGESYMVALQDIGGRNSGILVVSADGSAPTRRLTRTISRFDLLEPGHLLLWEAGAVRAYTFDFETLELGKEAVRLADAGWSSFLAYGRYAVSSGDMLVLQPGGGPVGDTELITVDRLGREISVVAPLAEYYSPSISHDGRRFAVDITDIQSTHGDVWVFDLERETRTRLAHGELDESDPVWSPDDRALYYRRVPDIFRRDADGARQEETVLKSLVNKEPEDVSPDGRLMIFESEMDENADLWLLDLETGLAEVWLENPWREQDARFSPDGRWVAYTSEESGTAEIHVRSFPAGDRRIVVSTGGGVSPLWSSDGSELFFYSASSEVVSVPVEWIGGEPRFGELQPLFRVRLRRTDHGFDVFPDGRRFLLNRVVTETDPGPLTLIDGWRSLLQPSG